MAESIFPTFDIDVPMPAGMRDPKPDYEALWKADNARLAVESKLAEDLGSALRAAEREIDALRRQRTVRDAFLVRHDLWQRFTVWLPRRDGAITVLVDELNGRSAVPDSEP